MKIQITMKDPDTLHDAIREAVQEELNVTTNLSNEEKEKIIEIRCGKLREIACQWFEYGEYLTVEIDSDANTCVVIPK